MIRFHQTQLDQQDIIDSSRLCMYQICFIFLVASSPPHPSLPHAAPVSVEKRRFLYDHGPEREISEPRGNPLTRHRHQTRPLRRARVVVVVVVGVTGQQQHHPATEQREGTTHRRGPCLVCRYVPQKIRWHYTGSGAIQSTEYDLEINSVSVTAENT